MRRLINVLVVFPLSLCCSFPATELSAAVIERDWKAPGDGLLTFDTVNKREWLDLSQSLLTQFPGATIEDRYQSVVAELGLGGLFEGFAVAKSADAIALAQSAGIDTSTHEFAVNNSASAEIISLLGETLLRPNERRFSIGLLDQIDNSLSSMPVRMAMIFDHEVPEPLDVGGAGLFLTGHFDAIRTQSAGVSLWRMVPEPIGFILMTCSLTCIFPTRLFRVYCLLV